MNQSISVHQEELESLCRRHHVRRLALFGSAVTAGFEPGRSDLDFTVEFQPLSPSQHADAYFGLLLDLEDLFQRHIDLVEEGAIENPFFRETVEQTRALLYAA